MKLIIIGSLLDSKHFLRHINALLYLSNPSNGYYPQFARGHFLDDK